MCNKILKIEDVCQEVLESEDDVKYLHPDFGVDLTEVRFYLWYKDGAYNLVHVTDVLWDWGSGLWWYFDEFCKEILLLWLCWRFWDICDGSYQRFFAYFVIKSNLQLVWDLLSWFKRIKFAVKEVSWSFEMSFSRYDRLQIKFQQWV